MTDPCAGMRARMAHYRVRAERLQELVERAIRAADWEPGDAQRALQDLRDGYQRVSGASQ